VKTHAAILGFSVFLFFTAGVQAHALSEQECTEGSDFIRNAALSRDGGMSASTFLGKMRDDLALIKSFPAELRWFVQDQQDEDFLIAKAIEVFEKPEDPQIHQRRFFAECVARASSRGQPSAALSGRGSRESVFENGIRLRRESAAQPFRFNYARAAFRRSGVNGA